MRGKRVPQRPPVPLVSESKGLIHAPWLSTACPLLPLPVQHLLCALGQPDIPSGIPQIPPLFC